MPPANWRPALLLAVSELHPETECAHDLVRAGHYRSAVRDAAEQFLARLQQLAELSERADVQNLYGSRLINRMFAAPEENHGPVLVFNPLTTRVERDEHNGYRSLALGMTQALRNVLTHDVDRQEMEPAEALEWLGFISAMHRRFDQAALAPQREAGS